jgi:hypothetical protein
MNSCGICLDVYLHYGSLSFRLICISSKTVIMTHISFESEKHGLLHDYEKLLAISCPSFITVNDRFSFGYFYFRL